MPDQSVNTLRDPGLEPTRLGQVDMDATHAEFIELLNQVNDASGADFVRLFDMLYEHTEHHFSNEQRLMTETRFPATGEHVSDHQRILGQLAHFRLRVSRGRMQLARAFIREQLPDWFTTHLATMDSALAAHINTNTPGKNS